MKEFKLSYLIIVIFLGGSILRLVPEILAGPWPLGFDTITYYGPIILNWADGNFSPADFNGYAPLCYFLLFLVYRLSGNVFFALKFIGPLLYGLLCSCFFFFVFRGLGWNNGKGLLTTFLFSIYFLSLRISWDFYRNMLGLAFFFLFLSFLSKFDELPKSRKIIASTLAILVTISHEIVSVIMFLVVCSSFALDIFKRKDSSKIFESALWFVPSLLIFFFIIFNSAIMFHEVPGSLNYFTDVSRGIVYDSYFVLARDVFSLFLLTLGPLLPFVILGFWRDRKLDSWSLICLSGSFWPFFYPWFQIVPWNRWMYMLGPTFIIYAVNGFDRLKMLKKKCTSHKRFYEHFSKLAVVLMMIGGISVVYMIFPLSVTLSQDLTIAERLGHYLPGSMLCNTFPLNDCDDFEKCFHYVNENLGNGAVLIIHESMRGWARLYLDEEKNVINYHFNSPLDGVSEALSQGYERIYLIWWKNGYGWYDQKSLPSDFRLDFSSSYAAVYKYELDYSSS